MGNVQMEADQIRYKDSSGTYRNVQTGLAAAIAGGGGGSSTLAGLTDTDISSPTNGQVLAYDSTESKWVNAASASGATTLEGLTDTSITTPADGQVLTYDSTASKWENAAIPAQSIDGLSDTTISTPTDGQVLTYDSTSSKWVNASGGSGGGGEVYPPVGTEVKVGTWMGYDMYRQVFQATSSSGSTNVSMGTIPNGYYPVAIRGYYKDGNSSILALPTYAYITSALKYAYAQTYLDPQASVIKIEVSNNVLGSGVDYIVIVDYLKSAPTP